MSVIAQTGSLKPSQSTVAGQASHQRTAWRFGISLLVLGCFSLVAFAEFVFAFSWKVPSTALVIGFFSTGMAHGAVDPWQLARVGLFEKRWSPLISYLFLMAGSAFALLLAPGIAIAAFLLAAALHFGIEDRRPNMFGPMTGAAVMGRGLLVVGLPIALHWEPSLNFLQLCQRIASTGGLAIEGWNPLLMVGDQAIGIIVISATILSHLLLAASAMITSLVRSHHRHGDESLGDAGPVASSTTWWLESALLLVCACLMHPLFFIGFYLAGWHAIKSFAASLAEHHRSKRRSMILTAVFATIPIWMLVVLFWIQYDPATELTAYNLVIGKSSQQLAAFVFLSYVIVTPPHMWWHFR